MGGGDDLYCYSIFAIVLADREDGYAGLKQREKTWPPQELLCVVLGPYRDYLRMYWCMFIHLLSYSWLISTYSCELTFSIQIYTAEGF